MPKLYWRHAFCRLAYIVTEDSNQIWWRIVTNDPDYKHNTLTLSAGQARCVCLHNSGTDVTGAINCFPVVLKACSTGKDLCKKEIVRKISYDWGGYEP